MMQSTGQARMTRPDQRRGFALLAALWLIVAITTLALEFGLQSHEWRRTTMDLDMRTQAQAAAMAGVETERVHLIKRFLPLIGTPVGYDLLSTPDTEHVGRGMFIVRIVPNALLNVNRMSEEMWRNFLLAFGVDYDTADRLAQAIMDWRDPDDLPRARGAEREAYLRAGALALPTNKNFSSVQELRDVMGMTPELYAAIAPYLSVCVSGLINVAAAPSPVLHAIPGFNDEVVSTILAQRAADPFNGNLGDIENRVSHPARQGLEEHADSIRALLPSLHNTIESFMGLVVVSTGWAPDQRTHVTMEAQVDNNATILWRCDE